MYPCAHLVTTAELTGDNSRTREKMLVTRPVKVFRIMGPKETITHDKVMITNWMHLLALEKSRQPALPERKAKLLHELVRGPAEKFPNASISLVRVYRAHLMNGTHPSITKREYLWKFLDTADLKDLFSSEGTRLYLEAGKQEYRLRLEALVNSGCGGGCYTVLKLLFSLCRWRLLTTRC